METSISNRLSTRILAASSEVLREMGFGLHPDIYKLCLYNELLARNTNIILDYRIPVFYKNTPLNFNIQVDLFVENTVMIIICNKNQITSADETMMKSALSIAKKPLGLLLNYHSPNFIHSFKKITNPIRTANNNAL
ncbi:MAG: GxxExxY protein [Bacteroidales bacterium]|nr:GxxExxY protein [Bacteroidales bacterium]MDY0216470.1 GxxExxY protein [Bacteroidales bacterium]